MVVSTNKCVFICALFLIFWNKIFAIKVLVKPVISKRSFPQTTNLNFSKNWTNECDVPCVWSGDTADIDAVFYFLTNNFDVFWASMDKKRAPIRIGGSTEGKHLYSLLSNENINRYIGTSSIPEIGSEIPWRVGCENYREIHKVIPNKNSLKIAVSTNSDCDSKNNREKILMEIDQIMPVARIGKCLNNDPWPICSGYPCTEIEAIRKYAFCIAFESGNSPGYVTEKIFNCQRAGSIPVYLGTEEVAKMVPRGSFIFVRDFKTAFDLANYLVLVATNYTLFESYFAWKKVPIETEFLERNKPFWEYSNQCRVCRYVSVVQEGLKWDIRTQNATSDAPSPYSELKLTPEISSNNKRLKIRSYISTEHSNSTNQLLRYSLLSVTVVVILGALKAARKFRIFSHLRFLGIK